MSEYLTASSTEADDLLRRNLERILASGNKLRLLHVLHDEYAANVAEVLDSMDADRTVELFRILIISDVELCAEILVELEPATISLLYEHLSIQEWAWVFRELSDDDVVWILEFFPEEVRPLLVDRMPREDKEDILELMTYPEESAGRIMTNEFIAMDGENTVSAATERVRSERELDPMNLFFIYVTEQDRLVGMVSLRMLLLGKKQALLKDIMRTDVVPVDVNADQEEVAELVRRHDEVTVPVVDSEGHILGIITMDDIIDVIDEESDEDLYRIIGSSDEELLVAGKTMKIVGLRLPWIIASFFGSLMVAMVMKYSESDLFGRDAAKIFIFVPMICAMGGNVGVQSATIMARLLSASNPNWREARRSAVKEARVGMTLGVICGTLIGVVAYFLAGGLGMLITVMSAMISAMTTAAVTGTLIPILMKKIGFDPALATGPFVTSFNDLVATIVYFSIAFLFLQKTVM